MSFSVGKWELPKSEWGPGPWQDEPDRLEWRAYGLPALMLRADVTGAWCGYVGVPPGHPLHGVEYGACPDDLEVHGGLTYSRGCSDQVCHTPEPGESDDVWWLGFDCAHANDLSPRMLALSRTIRESGLLPSLEGRQVSLSDLYDEDTYRDVSYVRNEVERLALQLSDIAAQLKLFS